MSMRALPIVAAAAIALSGCQWWGEHMGTTKTSATSGTGQTGGATAAAAGEQAVSQQMVQTVQRRLSDRGYEVGQIDGIWGESTAGALKKFQKDKNLQASGQLDEQTLAALGVAAAGAATTAQPAGRGYVPTAKRTSSLSGNAVRQAQQQLENRGYDVGAVDGRWGPGTRQALMRFQQDRSLPANGQLDEQTMAALGMPAASEQMGAVPEPMGRR